MMSAKLLEELEEDRPKTSKTLVTAASSLAVVTTTDVPKELMVVGVTPRLAATSVVSVLTPTELVVEALTEGTTVVMASLAPKDAVLRVLSSK